MIRHPLQALLISGSLGFGIAAAEPPAADKLGDHKKLAQAFLDSILKQDYAAASKEFDDTMKKVLPNDKLSATWKGLIEKVGAFKKQTGQRAEQGAKYAFVYITCQFEKSTLDLRVVFDADKKIAGFSLVPPKGAYEFKPPPYAKAELFSESKV